MQDKKIVVVDLDGTLISVNSYPRWVAYIFKQTALDGEFTLSLQVLKLLLWRKMGGITHQMFKKQMMMLQYKSEYDIKFARELMNQVRLNVVNALKALDKPFLVLSTAAPVNYSSYFQQVAGLKFDAVLSSRVEKGKLIENHGEGKVDNFLDKFGDSGCDIFFTDHHEDLPMMHLAKKVFLVSPTHKTRKLVRESGIEFWSLD